MLGIVYHPPSADDGTMLDYLSTSLTTIEGLYPGSGIMLTSDFNRLSINRLLAQFKMKEMVCVPTRAEQTLDLIITNLPQLYGKESVKNVPPFALSDHNVVVLHPKTRPP